MVYAYICTNRSILVARVTEVSGSFYGTGPLEMEHPDGVPRFDLVDVSSGFLMVSPGGPYSRAIFLGPK